MSPPEPPKKGDFPRLAGRQRSAASAAVGVTSGLHKVYASIGSRGVDHDYRLDTDDVVACAFGLMGAVLGVATLSYLPFALFCILSPVLSVICGFTGFRIVRVPASTPT